MFGLAPLGLSLAALLGVAAGAPMCLSQQLRMQGDYMLGGLFPMSSTEGKGLGHRTKPEISTCTGFSALGLLWALAMKMAVEEINNGSHLLPGLRLGYDLLDTCAEPTVAMKPSLVFLTKAGSHDIAAYCNYTQYQPRVLAVIGPHSSELALVTGKFFGFFLMPQVSYGASTDRLSNRETFPSFFRTVPSDRVQLQAIVELLMVFGWNWVVAIGSDDEYGRQGLSIFSSLASARGICIAHEGVVPLPRGQSTLTSQVEKLMQIVNQSSVQVVVLFSSALAAHTLFSYCVHSQLEPKVWVASEAWLASELLTMLPGMEQVGTILGFLMRGSQLPEFSEYVARCLALASDPAFCASLDTVSQGLEEDVVGPRCPHCDHITMQNLSAGLLHHQTFAAYAAVYSVAQALHNTLHCNASGCPARDPVRPWQLLEKMYNMSFWARDLEMAFDASGNVDMQYDLKLWLWQNKALKLHTVGSFDGQLQFNRSQIKWHTWDNKEPVSQCSRQCADGQVRRVKGSHSCCYDCTDCKAGTYRSSTDDLFCHSCDLKEWSPDRSTRCFLRTPKFLAWGEPTTLGLLMLLGLVLGLVLATLGLFLCHQNSPMVQASGGPLACFGLACLGMVCLSVLLFPGWPSSTSCLAQQPLSHLPLTGCLSTLFLQAAETFVESELPQGWTEQLQGQLRGPGAWLVVLLTVLAEAALCTWYLVAFPPEVVTNWKALPQEVLVHCQVRSWISFGLVHTVNATLAFLCFLGTFLVQSQPGRYNRARGLTFAMLAYFIIWISFVPILANVHVAYQPAVQMGAILLCALGILAAVYLPKCYLLLWHPALNTPEFFLGERTGVVGETQGNRESGPTNSPSVTTTQ